jgi:hypothetical protein
MPLRKKRGWIAPVLVHFECRAPTHCGRSLTVTAGRCSGDTIEGAGSGDDRKQNGVCHREVVALFPYLPNALSERLLTYLRQRTPRVPHDRRILILPSCRDLAEM